jgi:hypothetical protein
MCGYDLAPGPDPESTTSTYLPAALRPNSEFGASTIGDIITFIGNWQRQRHPAEIGGRWAFDLTCYLSPNQARLLLRLSHISFPTAQTSATIYSEAANRFGQPA